MKRYTSFGLLTLLLAMALASCSGSGRGEQGSGGPADGRQEMDHGNMKHGAGGMMDASGMLMKNGEYSDERFIDAMTPHHQGAVEMAQVALENAEHRELRQLAQNIITDQQSDIERFRVIKERDLGSSDLPTETSSEEMAMMGMMEDPGELADREPFDKAFIDEMIPHHVAAIEMARLAEERTGNPKIRELARNIVETQEAEISQMTEWRREWYP